MKIVCDACGTKYSIGDDRVAGKVFKIRCKKCSQIIVVKGAVVEPAPLPAPDVVPWHLAIDGQQSGPFERAELQRRHAAGELDDDTLVWRDGMDEWRAFGAIAELADGTARTELPAVEPPRADDKRLLAERNESSVLFTLGNLAKLASSAPAAKAAPAKPAASGEGSGLIDIRALASTFTKPSAVAAAPAVGSSDDLPTFGPTTFGEPIVLLPVARQRPDRKMIYALFAALAMLVIIGAVLLVIVLRDDPPAVASAPAPTRVASLAPIAEPPAAPIAAPSPVAAPAPTPAPAPPPPIAASPPRPTIATRPPPRPAPTPRPTPAPVPAPRPTPAVTPGRPDKVQCEFSGFAEKGCEIYKPAAPATTASNLPENLDRGAIAAGLGTIRAQSCGGKSSSRGDVAVQIRVNADGGVSGVTVKSSPDPALSACVVAAAQKGTFAKTRRGASFGYVWRF